MLYTTPWPLRGQLRGSTTCSANFSLWCSITKCITANAAHYTPTVPTILPAPDIWTAPLGAKNCYYPGVSITLSKAMAPCQKTESGADLHHRRFTLKMSVRPGVHTLINPAKYISYRYINKLDTFHLLAVCRDAVLEPVHQQWDCLTFFQRNEPNFRTGHTRIEWIGSPQTQW